MVWSTDNPFKALKTST